MGAVDKTVVAAEPSLLAAEEPRVLCIINHANNPSDKKVINWPVSTTCSQLIADVEKKFCLPADAFELVYELPFSNSDEQRQIVVNTVPEKTVGELCVVNQRNTFFLYVKEENSQFLQATSSASGQPLQTGVVNQAVVTPVTDNHDTYGSSDGYISNTSTSASYESYSYASAVIKSDTGYVGLVNQAMTCYLNSLLQTLYMTPEFRNAVYRWEYDGTVEEAVKSIPYQLQRLFLQLQTSTKRAVETTDMTRSFGWDSSEAWQQHDVQELCRVMFDALERSWKNTDQAELITQLYQGKIKDYVKCLQCGSESARTDTYLDIPLVVRPFGSNIGYGSVEEALRAFVEPEILDGSNQYFCEKCACKCDAHKGLKFLTFPYLLTMQLKRFDFDYTTMHRIKLNDRMSFPERLILSHLIDGENDKDAVTSKEREADPTHCRSLDVSSADRTAASAASMPADDGDTVTSNEDEGIEIDDHGAASLSPPDNVNGSDDDFSDAGRCVLSSLHAGQHSSEAAVYELFSIMVHSGGSSGGHYYAYIKSFKDNEWYSFNDQHVYKIMQDDIEKTFGGSSYSNSYYSSYSTYSSANAYMLMYRQIDPARNKQFIQRDEFPEHLVRELELLRKQEANELLQRELERNTCKIKLYYYDTTIERYMESKLEVHRSKTLAEATEIAWKQLPILRVDFADFRLVKFDSIHEYIERSFDDDWDSPMSLVLGGVKSIYTFDLLAETKQPHEQFEPYYAGDAMIRIHEVDLESETIGTVHNMRISLSRTVAELKLAVAAQLTVSVHDVRCVTERYYNTLKPLDVPSKTLLVEGFQKTNKMYVEFGGDSDDHNVGFTRSRLYRLLDRHQNTIRLLVNVPKMSINMQQQESSLHNSLFASAAVDQETAEADEGIGESETDVASSIDADASCPSYCQRFSSETSSAPTHENVAKHSERCDKQATCETDPVLSHAASPDDNRIQQNLTSISANEKSSLTDVTETENVLESQDWDPPLFNVPKSTSLHSDDHVSPGDAVEMTLSDDSELSQTCDVLKSVTANDDDPALSEDSGSSQTLSVTRSSSLNDDDQGSLTDVTETPHSEDSGSSRTVEVGDDDIPQLLDDDEVDAGTSLPTQSLIPDAVEPGCPPASLQSSEVMTSSASWMAEETVDSAKDMTLTKESGENWDEELSLGLQADGEEVTCKYNYCVVQRSPFPLGYERTLFVSVDRRITLKSLKAALEPHVGTSVDNFKVYRVSQSGQETEETYLSDTLVNYSNDARINIKYGRALKPGEHRVHLCQLIISDPEPIRPSVEVILAKGMTVLDAKTVIVQELQSQGFLKLDIDRCRLRRKSWKNPGRIYADNSAALDEGFGSPICSDLMFEMLDGPEQVHSSRGPTDVAFYVRRWWPSKYEIDCLQEIYITDLSLDTTLNKISEISNIPFEDICVAKAKGTFPHDVSVMELEKELEWNPKVSLVSQWPLTVNDDGCVLIYKDGKEALMQLNDEQRKQLQQRESCRVMKHISPPLYSHRKERALKIYTADLPSKTKLSDICLPDQPPVD